jgi:hypothetical protein
MSDAMKSSWPSDHFPDPTLSIRKDIVMRVDNNYSLEEALSGKIDVTRMNGEKAHEFRKRLQKK